MNSSMFKLRNEHIKLTFHGCFFTSLYKVYKAPQTIKKMTSFCQLNPFPSEVSQKSYVTLEASIYLA